MAQETSDTTQNITQDATNIEIKQFGRLYYIAEILISPTNSTLIR